MKTSTIINALCVMVILFLSTTGVVMAQIHYDSSGNFGIGTMSPDSKLEVDGTVTATAFVGDGSGLTGIGGGNGDGYSLDAADGNPVDAVYVNNEGNLGIGTTAPKEKLDIDGDVYIDGSGSTIGGTTLANGALKIGSTLAMDNNEFYYGIDGYIGTIGPYNLIFKLNGSERMRIQSNGKIGIGPKAPETDLHISDTGLAGIKISGGSLGYFPYIQLDDEDTGGVAWNIENGREAGGVLGFYYDGTKIVIKSNGNVGIGTTTPNAKLDVYEAGDGYGVIISGPNGYSVRGGSLKLSRPGNDAGDSDMGFANLNGTIVIDDNAVEAGLTHSTALFAFKSTGDLLVNTGNLGIGTTSPGEKLDVNGTVKATAFNLNGDVITTWPSGGGSGDGHSLDATDGSPIDVVYVNNQGNVGIGTTDPDYKLQVNGTAYATGAAGALSDLRHKKNVSNISFDAIEVINQLRPVSFEWKEPEDSGMEGTQLGFIAQEVEEVLPEAVLTQDNEEQTKGLKYNALITVLVEAIKAQQVQIEELKTINIELKARIEKLDI
ncbi:MAG: tail fiber domain-containing protein [bacterium]